MTVDRSLKAALLAVVIGAVAVGFSPIYVRLSELPPTATAFYRTALALPLLIVWLGGARAAPLPRRKPGRREVALMILAGCLFAGDLATWHWSIHYTTVANATLFANFAPVVVAAGAWLLFGERVTRGFALGLALALAGCLLLVGGSLSLGGEYFLGDMLGILTAFWFGAYLLTVKTLRRTLPVGPIMFWSTLVTALLLLPLSWISGESLAPATLYGWSILVMLAWISHVMGQGFIAYGLGHLPAAFSSLVILLEPLTAAILGWILLGEALGPLEAAGGALVMAGIFAARRATAVAVPAE